MNEIALTTHDGELINPSVMDARLDTLAAKSPHDRLEEWLANLTANTRRAYTKDLRGFALYYGAATISEALVALCGRDHKTALAAVEAYRDHLITTQRRDGKGPMSSATINRRLSAINSALAQLAKADMGHGRLDVDLVAHEARHDTVGPGVAQVSLVVDQLSRRAGRDIQAARDLAIVLLAVQRGLRRSEIAALTLDDVHIDACQLRVLRKGKKEKVTIDIAGTTCEALTAWLAARSRTAWRTPALFVALSRGHKGQALGDHGVWDIVRRAGETVGAVWKPHGLRHTAITEALRLTNGSLVAAQELAGHAQPSTTARYVDDKRRLQRQAVDALGTLYALPKR